MKTSQTERVPDEELDQMIWKLERDGGMTPKLLSLMRELREVRMAKPVAEICQAHEYGIGGELTHNRDIDYYQDDIDHLPVGAKLYAAPIAPVDLQVAEYEEIMDQVIPDNSFTNEELEGMAHGDNPQANAYRELLARRNSPVTPDGWIPVSERMPLQLSDEDVDGVDVIVTDGILVGTCECRRGYLPHPWVEWSNYGDIDAKNITHWQPLPAAPKEVG
ncbi:DUF551 domain-containing protein [Kluyvera ascorbata]|uniref:DUF551 domain-containing protein n=1 Tax=Kluyvera ascorbata TaxID=51288 RepID=UPI00350F9CE6